MNALRLSGAALVLSVSLAVAAVLGGSASGCEGAGIDVWNCYAPDGAALGTEVTGDPSVRPADCPCAFNGPLGQTYPQGDCPFVDGGADAGGPLPGCNGQCIANAPLGWSPPALLWFGDETKAPPCPASAPGLGYEGYAGLTSVPLPCGSCSCAPLTGSCGLPATITASAVPCPGAGAPAPFDGPVGWDGGCTANDAISSDVQSVTAAALVVNETGCTPQQAPVQQDPPGVWSVFGRGCTSSAGGACDSTGETCAPAAPDGFRQCVFYKDDVACPDVGPYTDKHVFYTGANDTRDCSPCACTSAPGSCSATLSVYVDGACSSAAIASDTLTSAMPICFGVADAPLGSKSIGPATYTPGTCASSGGEPMGSVVPLMPSTFCCIPPP